MTGSSVGSRKTSGSGSRRHGRSGSGAPNNAIRPSAVRVPMRGHRDPREPATFAILVLAGFVVARFLAVALHEVVGHGLTTLALGGAFYGVYISPGAGVADVLVPPGGPAPGGAGG